MNALDEQITRLLRDRIAEAPAPLSAEEIVLRSDSVSVAAGEPNRRWVWPVLVATAAAVVAVVLVVDRTREGAVEPAVPGITDAQLLLPSLSAEWVPADVRVELSQGGAGGGTPVAIYVRAHTEARLQLVGSVGPRHPTTLAFEAEHTLDLGDGRRGSYSWDCGSTCFDVVDAGFYMHGYLPDVDLTEREVETLASQVAVDDTGMPSIPDSTGFVLERSGRLDVAGLETLSMDFRSTTSRTSALWVSITTGSDLPHPGLVAGADATRREWAGQEYWSDGVRVVWSRSGALYSVIVFSFPPTTGASTLDPLDLATSMEPATWDEVADLAAQIGSAALVAEAAELEIVGRTLSFEERRIRDEVYLCLADGDAPTCRIVMANAVVSILVDGHWYLVQYDGWGTLSPIEEMVVVGENRWRVSAIADDVTTVQIGVNPTETINRPRF